MTTQGRLRGLLRANQMVTGGLALPTVLRRVVEAARELVGTRYAALGVLAPGGGLAEAGHTIAVPAAAHRPPPLTRGLPLIPARRGRRG